MESLLAELSRISDYGTYGRVAGVQGLLIEVAGLYGTVSVGTRSRRQISGYSCS